jgi:type IV pilus assembly protein PilE
MSGSQQVMSGSPGVESMATALDNRLQMKRGHPSSRRCGGALGFTLIELMLVMVIVAVLAAIALPAYQSQVRKSRRAEAITSMSQIQQAQERYRANRPSYADRLMATGGRYSGVGTSADAGATGSVITDGGYYLVSLTAVTPTGYTLLATAQGAQVNDGNCRHLQLVQAGGNITTNSGAANGAGNGSTSAENRRCWNR